MRLRQLAAWSMVLGSALVGSAPAAWSQGPVEFSDVVIFATNSISLGENTRVASGSVVVNDASGGPTLRGTAELSIDKNGTFAGDLVADTLVLDKKNDVAGAILCNDGTGVSCGGLFLPVFAEEELPEMRLGVLSPGAADVAVPNNGQISLDAGDYADVTAGNGATIVFTGGVYNVGSILAGNDVSLVFAAAAELRILGKLGMGNNAFIGPGTGGTASASNLEILVGGTNLDPNDPSSLPAAASFSNNATLEAFVYAPFGTLRCKNNAVGKGVFAGRDVAVGNNGRFILSGANPPPTADGQTVFTDDTTPLQVTLTGSDPGDDPLTFTIVSGPAQGALSAVTQNPPDEATVVYTAAQAGNLTDSFVFRVTDPGGAFAEAVVLINPVDTPVPPTPTGTVIAQDDAVEGIVNTELAITLAGLPDVENSAAIGDLTFSIVSGPSSGALAPDPPTPVSEPPAGVRSARTNYLPNLDFAGADSFVFEVCGDLDGDLDTADPGECDTATISITVNPFVPPEDPEAPPVESRALLTQVDTPLEIELAAVTGPSEGPGGGRPELTAGPVPGPSFKTFHAKAAVTFSDEATFLAALSSSSTYDFEQPTFPAASAIIGVVDGIDFSGRIGFAVNPPPPSGTQFMRGTGLSAPYDGPGLINFSGLEILPNAVGFFTGFGSIAAPAPVVRVTITFANESETTFFIAHDPPSGSYFGFADAEQAILAVELQGFEADFETEAIAKQFGIDDLTVGTAGDVDLPDLVVASLTHDPASPVVETQILFTAEVENVGAAPADASTLCFQIGGESCASPETLFAVPALLVGETFTVERTAALPAASYQNTAIADFAGVVAESDEENNTAIDTYTVAGPGDGLFATIVALPQFGTLLNQNGLAITSLGAITGTRVTYVPATGSAVPDFFQFTVTDAATSLTSAVARIDLFFAVVFDPCALVGRPPGCLPG